MNKSDALSMNEHIEKMTFHVNHVLYVANNCGDEDVKQRTQKALAFILGELYAELLAPIYKEFPEMRPVDR